MYGLSLFVRKTKTSYTTFYIVYATKIKIIPERCRVKKLALLIITGLSLQSLQIHGSIGNNENKKFHTIMESHPITASILYFIADLVQYVAPEENESVNLVACLVPEENDNNCNHGIDHEYYYPESDDQYPADSDYSSDYSNEQVLKAKDADESFVGSPNSVTCIPFMESYKN